MTYRYLGAALGGNRYEVTLSIYEDCTHPAPNAIANDSVARISVFEGNRSEFIRDREVVVPSVPIPADFSNLCLVNPPTLCLLKKTFVLNYTLPLNASGYIIAYQRCCRNASVINITNAGESGATYYCNIPPASVAADNNSAVFNNYPPQIICLNEPLVYDNSAADPDGDSLSYEFCDATDDPNSADSSYPTAPSYLSTTYISPPYSGANPILGYPALQINPRTGIITGTPNHVGRFLVTVCCHEWRAGVLINTVKREFQFVINDCSKAVTANIPQYSADYNTYETNCTDYTIHFDNISKGGTTWHWDFGVPGLAGDTSADFEPVYTYPDTGTYIVKLIANPAAPCKDSIERYVKIYPKFTAVFADTGRFCPGDSIQFTDQTRSTFKPVTSWTWLFGDGDTAMAENPVHSYQHGGVYSVVFISQNVKNCTDTSVRELLIDNFQPFAGNDTIIIKGQRVAFHATGGTAYTWLPGIYLDNDSIYNPVGYYPDTGRFTYYVRVQSPLGCTGYDTIKVQVVGQASFFVPTGFSPNGDALNDIFKPIAIGYRSLNYLRVFNRWGQLVYEGHELDSGWDGTYQDKPAELGTYYWEISFNDLIGAAGFVKGDVTLVR